MRRIPFVWAIAFIIGCTAPETPVQEAVSTLDPDKFLFEEHAEILIDKLEPFPNGTEVSIALISNGKPYYYGLIRENDTLLSKENHKAVFEIGSISKVFTSTLLAGYVTEGSIDLDDNVNDYLDFQLKDDLPISLVSLSNHTSGLPRMPSNFMWTSLLNPKNPYKNYDEEKLTEYLTEKVKLEFDPGSKSSYSNLGVGLLAFTLAKKNGQDYQEMLSSRIFEKYGMTQSTTVRTDIEESLVKGRDEDGNVTSNWDLGALGGAGGILSSVSDLSRFAFAQFDTTNQELTLTRQMTFQNPDGYDVGLGWFIVDNDTSNPWFWHNGGTGGYSSSMGVSTQTQDAVIILTNISAFHEDSRRVDALCTALMTSLLEGS